MPYTTGRAHSRGQCYKTPGVSTSHGTAAHRGWPIQAPAPGMAPGGGRGRGPGTAAVPGAMHSLRSLGWGPVGERRQCWQGLAEAQPDVLHQV